MTRAGENEVLQPMAKGSTSDDPLSDEALAYLKTYKYQSVDKSWISNHILRHYVRLLPDTP